MGFIMCIFDSAPEFRLAILLGKVFTDARGWSNPESARIISTILADSQQRGGNGGEQDPARCPSSKS